jgi:hypothetical protein
MYVVNDNKCINYLISYNWNIVEGGVNNYNPISVLVIHPC